MNNRIKRTLSVLVAVLLLFSALPLGVFAASGTTEITATVRQKRTVTVEHPEHGKVVVLAPLRVYDGDTVEFTVTPDYGYALTAATCNGVNVTASMVGNTYTHTVSGDVTFSVAFTAQFSYTVMFSGAAVSARTVDPDEKVTKPNDPTRSGYTFGGWYADEDCKQAWNFEQDTVKGDMTLYAKWIQNSTPKATIHGNVTESSSPVPNATVELFLGVVKVAATKTDEQGQYSFDNVENGTYDIVVTKEDGKTKTELVTVNTTGGYSVDVELPASDVSSIVEHNGEEIADAKSDISQTVVGGLDEIALSNAQEGDIVKVKLTVEPKADADTVEQKKIKSEAGDGKKVEFLDLTLTKTVNGVDTPNFGSTNNQLLTIVVPFDFTGMDVSGVMILRNHGGNTEKLKKNPADGQEGFVVDEQAGTLTIYAMKFSEYAIAYDETGSEPEQPERPVRPGGGSYAAAVNSTENGTVTLDKKFASAGDTVTMRSISVCAAAERRRSLSKTWSSLGTVCAGRTGERTSPTPIPAAGKSATKSCTTGNI